MAYIYIHIHSIAKLPETAATIKKANAHERQHPKRAERRDRTVVRRSDSDTKVP